MSDLNLEHIIHEARRAGEDQITAEECLISNTVNDEDADVWVTLPNSEAPQQRLRVDYWSLQVTWTGAALAPRWPSRGTRGLVIYMDTGEAWLIY